jgi:hypothetical protein
MISKGKLFSMLLVLGPAACSGSLSERSVHSASCLNAHACAAAAEPTFDPTMPKKASTWVNTAEVKLRERLNSKQ